MILLQGVISGLFATIIFDLFNISLNFSYGIEKPKWNLLGRYFLGYKESRFFRNVPNRLKIKLNVIVASLKLPNSVKFSMYTVHINF